MEGREPKMTLMMSLPSGENSKKLRFRMTDNMNGSFAIQSRPEQGTVITVEVPLLKTEVSNRGNSY